MAASVIVHRVSAALVQEVPASNIAVASRQFRRLCTYLKSRCRGTSVSTCRSPLYFGHCIRADVLLGGRTQPAASYNKRIKAVRCALSTAQQLRTCAALYARRYKSPRVHALSASQ